MYVPTVFKTQHIGSFGNMLGRVFNMYVDGLPEEGQLGTHNFKVNKRWGADYNFVTS